MRREQDVPRFDVCVDDAVGVEPLETRGERACEGEEERGDCCGTELGGQIVEGGD